MMLAAFVWPTLFWTGAGAVSVPILIHLLARRRFKRVRWAAIEFLLQAERRNRRRVRLEDFILMMLRCLAVLLIGMLVARPFVRPEGLAALLGGADRTERVFVLDDSFSMGYRPGDLSSFDRAKRATNRLITMFREQSPHDTVTVLRTSAMAVPVSAGVFLDERQTQELAERIEGLTVSQFGLSSRDVFESLGRMLDEESDTINVAVYCVSDFQRKDWLGGLGPEGGRASPIAPLADAKRGSRSVRLALIEVGDDHPRNLAVTKLETERSRFVANVSDVIRATLANYSDAAAESLNLDVAIGPVMQPTVTVDRVAAGETTAAPVTVAFAKPGWNWVRVATKEDALPADDHRTLVVPTVEAVRILIVNGEPSSDPYRDEVTLLGTALRPPGEVFSGYDVEIIGEADLSDANVETFDVVALANVYRISDPAVETLTTFIGNGGGLAVFLGDQADGEFYNDVLFNDGQGILPAGLKDRVVPPGGVTLTADDELHPMVRVLAGRENPFVKQILFNQYFSCRLPEVNPSAEVQSVAARDPAKLVAHFNDADATPAIVERTYGRGRVVQFASTCDLEWNDWAKDPSYVVAMLQLAHHLARGGERSDVVVGAAIEFGIDPANYEQDLMVRTPAYPAEQEIALTAVPAEDGRGFAVKWDQTATGGVYQFVLTRKTGEQEIRAAAVNLDPTESDLSKASEAELKQSLHELPVQYVKGLEALEAIGEEARRELWRTVLMALFIVLMGEQVLAWLFGRRT